MKGLQRLRNERKAQKEAFENDKRELNKSKVHQDFLSNFIILKVLFLILEF